MAAAVSTADHCQAGPLGRRGAADLRGADFLAGFATALLRPEFAFFAVFAAFFDALFFLEAFLVAVFATPASP
jgi:hypothetical protein